MEKRVFIMAGINGSGKSTTAARVQKEFPSAVIVSADNYMVDESGKWQFDPAKLGLCHSLCQEAFHEALNNKIPVVIVDNTNLCHEHRWVYEKHALERGYDVTVFVHDTDVDIAVKRNIHGVPRHTLENQKRKLDLAPGVYNLSFDPARVA